MDALQLSQCDWLFSRSNRHEAGLANGIDGFVWIGAMSKRIGSGIRSTQHILFWRDPNALREFGLQFSPIDFEQVFTVPWYGANLSAPVACSIHVAAMFRKLLVVHPDIAKSPLERLCGRKRDPGSEWSSSIW
jgi:hypothetical protein